MSVVSRLSKSVVATTVSLFCLNVAWNNIADFDTNYQFVIHILSMDTLAPWFQGADEIGGRAITSPAAHMFFYCLIITGEGTAGILTAIGAYFLIRNIITGGSGYQKGKCFYFLGACVAILVWYFGFCVVGSEWFVMWTSTDWNAQATAYAFATYILLSLVYISSPEPASAKSD